MAKVIKAIAVPLAMAIGSAIGGPLVALAFAVIATVGVSMLTPKGRRPDAAAQALQLGEVPRQAVFGRLAVPGSLVDAFNYGGKYGTDWEVLVIALADHRCEALEGFYVNDTYVAFAADGAVAGYNGQLSVWWRNGTETQTVPAVLTTNGPGWTANDNGAGVAYVVVAYKADDADAKSPVWPGGRPRFKWVVKGARCYDPRKDTSVGGAGAQRWNDPATWAWSENPIVCRYTWARGLYACDRVDQPSQLLIGRGLSSTEAPPANAFSRANVCDELVGGSPRYRVGGLVIATDAFIDVEQDFAAACAGTITQPEGSVEIDPGEARAAVLTFTDRDLIVGSKARWSDIPSDGDQEWANSVVATFTDPAQQWSQRAAPIRRELADVTADRKPREARIDLGFVSWVAQASRVAEIRRRFGRLWGRGEVTLPPRFAGIEEGDWVIWQSDRFFKGGAKTFRVEAWSSNPAWHHTLTLRQISSTVYSEGAALTDGSVAIQQPAPPVIGAPAPGAWVLAAGQMQAGGMASPALIVTGNADDPAARFVRIEYVQGTAPITPATLWTDCGVTGPDVQRREIPVAAGGIYRVAVSYVVDGVPGDRRVLGPVTALAIAYPDGTPVEALKPAEAGANVTGTNVAAGITNQGALATQNTVKVGTNVANAAGTVLTPEQLLNNTLDGATGIVRVGFPVGGQNRWDDAVTGALRIDLPWGSASAIAHMVGMQIEVFDYASGAGNVNVQTYLISGYTYYPDGAWYAATAKLIGGGGAAKAVRFGRTGTRWSIWIGEPGTTWSYPRVSITNVRASYSSPSLALFETGWSIVLDAAAATNVTRHVANPTAGDAVFGVNALESWNGAVATLPNFKTPLGISAGFTGQGPWSTFSTLTPTTVSARVQNLQGDGTLEATNVYRSAWGALTSFWPAEYGANVTEARTAAAIAGQGALATRNNARVGLELVDESGAYLPPSYVKNNNNTPAGSGFVSRPYGGEFSYNASNVPGAIQIKLPNTIADGRYCMIKFQIDVFDYGNDTTVTYDVAGYVYAYGPAPAWLNCTAKVVGGGGNGSVKPVRFGRTGGAGGDRFCVWIGDTGTQWQYPQVVVRNVVTGYSYYSVEYWQAGWEVSTVTAAFPVVDRSIPNPTAGDAVFGVNALEAWNGAVATLPNFKTPLGVAAAISGQGALATKNTASLDSDVVDGATYARLRASETTAGGYHKLVIAGSGARLGDLRNVPRMLATNLAYKFTGAISYSATAGSPATATISVSAGSCLIGSATVSYNAMSAGVSGTNGTAVTYWLYIDDAAYAGGTQTLVATTNANAIYASDARVYIGSVTVVYPTTGGGGGGGDGGGGYCVAANSKLPCGRRARDLRPGTMIWALDYEAMDRPAQVRVEKVELIEQACITVETASGIRLTASTSTPVTLRDGSFAKLIDCLGAELPVMDSTGFRWERVTALRSAGFREVARIHAGGATYAAGHERGRSIFTHNPAKP